MASNKKLKRDLTLFNVYAIATGTTLSAGFFLLPGYAAQGAGPAMVLAYMVATLPLIPAMFSIVELCTAMPKAGGIYYFLDRSLGPLAGTIGGLGTWLALMLKVAFALVGMGFYLALYLPQITSNNITLVAVGLAIFLGLINLLGAKKSGSFQVFLVIGLLALLTLFVGAGVPAINTTHFENFLGKGYEGILSTAGLVYISYVGVTSVASLSEEVKDPEKNLPRGIFLSLATAMLIYGLGTAVMVGVIPLDELMATHTPVALAAEKFLGKWGMWLLSLGAILAFVSVANAGTMSASRFPLAMSRDKILPRFFRYVTSARTPYWSIIITTSLIVTILVVFDPLKIAKLASAFQLLMFAMICLAVIVMRESNLDSYDPGYRSPLYPWMQIFGIFTPLIFIAEMGWLPSLFAGGLVLIGFVWYWKYVRGKVQREGAIFHIFERLGQRRYEGLDYELREILKEKGLREKDPFEEVVARSTIIELTRGESFEKAVEKVARKLEKIVNLSRNELEQGFLEGTRMGATPVSHGAALPHFRTNHITRSELILVRAKNGVKVCSNKLGDEKHSVEKIVYALFFLLSPQEDPSRHLRILAQLAGHVDDEKFMKSWLSARDDHGLKGILLRDEHSLGLHVQHETRSGVLIGHPLKDLKFPEGCLVAMLRRKNSVVIPRGNTQVEDGDYLTIIGEPEAMQKIYKDYFG